MEPTTEVQDRIDELVVATSKELERAISLHASLNSAHEAYAVILEELDEFWDEVKRKRQLRDESAMRLELIQIAAMALRTVLDLNLQVSPMHEIAEQLRDAREE